MARKSALALSRSDDTFHIQHCGYPLGGLLRFHLSLGAAAVSLAVPLAVELGPKLSQAYFLATCLFLLYASIGYLLYLPFAALSGRVSLNPKEEKITFSKSVLGKHTDLSREIPWQTKLETEIERVGLKVPLLPLSFYRVKIVTDFMTYPVAVFGPGLGSTADAFSAALKKAQRGRGGEDINALLESGRFPAQTPPSP